MYHFIVIILNYVSFFSTKFESHNHFLLWGWLAINDKEVVCGRWNRFVKSPHSSVNSVLSRIEWLWKRYLSLCLHLKEWGKVCLRNKILSSYFVPISVHIVGDFLKVLVKIQIFMFVGDGNPAWLVEVKEQTLGKVRYPRLQKLPESRTQVLPWHISFNFVLGFSF